jgi:hypothetical protein
MVQEPRPGSLPAYGRGSRLVVPEFGYDREGVHAACSFKVAACALALASCATVTRIPYTMQNHNGRGGEDRAARK